MPATQKAGETDANACPSNEAATGSQAPPVDDRVLSLLREMVACQCGVSDLLGTRGLADHTPESLESWKPSRLSSGLP